MLPAAGEGDTVSLSTYLLPLVLHPIAWKGTGRGGGSWGTVRSPWASPASVLLNFFLLIAQRSYLQFLSLPKFMYTILAPQKVLHRR